MQRSILLLRRTRYVLLLLIPGTLGTQRWAGAQDTPKPKPEFRSTQPYWIPNGKATVVKILGQDLAPKDVQFVDSSIKAKITKVEALTPKDDAEKAKGNVAVEVEIAAPAGLKPDSYKFKLVHEGDTQPEGRIYIDDTYPEVEEKEPNDTLRAPQPLPPAPVAILGKLDNEGVDVFRIDGKAGEVWQFDILARRAGSQMEPILRLRDPRQISVQVAVDEGNDCTLKYRLTQDGAYLLEVFDGDNRTDKNYFYRLSARRLAMPAPQ